MLSTSISLSLLPSAWLTLPVSNSIYVAKMIAFVIPWHSSVCYKHVFLNSDALVYELYKDLLFFIMFL